MITKKRILSVAIMVGIVSVVLFLFNTVFHLGYAYARAVGAPGDAGADPFSLIGQLYDFIRTGKGTMAAGVALTLVIWGLRNLPFAKWKGFVATKFGGYLLGFVTSALAYLSVTFGSGNAVSFGLILNALGAALLASGGWEALRDAVLSLTNKQVPPVTTENIQKANTLVMVVLLLGATGTIIACDGCDKIANTPVIGQIVDCTKQDQSKIEKIIAEAGCKVVGGAILECASVTQDWATIEAEAEAAGVEIGGCALAELVQKYLTTRQTNSKAEVNNQWMAHDALEHFRATMAKGATFHTASGDL